MVQSTPNALLVSLGSRLRRQRLALSLTQRELAKRSGLSPRFLADVEAGRGNIALTRLATLARVLRVPLGTLVADLPGSPMEARPVSCGILALMGMRGAGKSTLGQALAERLAVPFVEMDSLIEQAAGMPLGEVFTIHGPAYFAELAQGCLDRLLAGGERSMVLATTGDVVSERETFEMLQRRTRTIWLQAEAQDHWQRVLDQGDFRPSSDRPNAFAELERLLARRSPHYALADHTVETSVLGKKGALEALMEIARQAPDG